MPGDGEELRAEACYFLALARCMLHAPPVSASGERRASLPWPCWRWSSHRRRVTTSGERSAAEALELRSPPTSRGGARTPRTTAPRCHPPPSFTLFGE